MNILKPTGTLLSGLIAAVAVFAASAAYAADEDVLPTAGDQIEEFWKSTYWTIYKNNTRQSCFIQWSGETSVVQAGLTNDQDAFYLGAFVKNFEPVEPVEGERGIAIVLNGNLYVGGVTTVSRTLSGGFEGGYILLDNPKFVADLEEAGEFIAFPDSPNTVTVTLITPRNAIGRARDCMATF
jgi:opacity protein-like surface antigen